MREKGFRLKPAQGRVVQGKIQYKHHMQGLQSSFVCTVRTELLDWHQGVTICMEYARDAHLSLGV